jgi:hypothetical protein
MKPAIRISIRISTFVQGALAIAVVCALILVISTLAGATTANQATANQATANQATANQATADQAPVQVAFGHVDITPKLSQKRRAYLAGFGMNRRATGVHDPLFARGLVLKIGGEKIALVCVDLIGLQYPVVKQIRAALPDYKYVMVSSTHNHEGPDVIGIWGSSPFQCGVDNRYLGEIVHKVVGMLRETEKRLAPTAAHYGTAADESLLGDSRLPKVYDGVLRVVRFDRPGQTEPAGVLVQWNCHPEALGSRNKLITADFPAATIAMLEARYHCPVAYFSGAIGGLMAPPDHTIKNTRGEELQEGDYAYAERYGQLVGELAAKAIDSAKPLDLSSIAISAKPVAIPLENTLYKVAKAIGVLRRDGRVWTGDPDKLGDPIPPGKGGAVAQAVETEVAYLRLGELHIACIPGELYPELVYGKFQDPVDPAADHPKAALETPVMKILPGEKTLLIGLANDEIGYIIPKRQWDQNAPFCYGREKSQYGEINSCGSEVAPILMQSLADRVRELSAMKN